MARASNVAFGASLEVQDKGVRSRRSSEFCEVCLLLLRLVLHLQGGHSNLGCLETFLKIVSLLKNSKSEGSKSIHF